MRPFFGTRRESFSILAKILPFRGTRPDSTNFRHSHRCDPFSVPAGKVFDTRKDSTFSRYWPGFYQFSVLTQIRPFFRYSSGPFFDTRTNSTFSRYSPGFFHFSILTQIRPFSGTRRESFSILPRILPFHGTRPNSTNFRYSHRFDRFSVLVGKVFRHSQGFYLFPVLSWILAFFGTHTDPTLF